MVSNQTENYGLNQWERSDKVQMEDFNADNAKIDAALKAEVDARTAALKAETDARTAAIKVETDARTAAVAAQAAALKEETEARTTAITLCAQFLASEVQERTALSSVVEKCGNCQIYTTTYTGTGKYGADNPLKLTFPDPPMLVIVVAPNGAFMNMVHGAPAALFPTNSPPSRQARLTWNGNSISWYDSNIDGHMNVSGDTYYVVALCSKS